MHQSIEAANDGSATLVPAILADCELPLLSRFACRWIFATKTASTGRRRWRSYASGFATITLRIERSFSKRAFALHPTPPLIPQRPV